MLTCILDGTVITDKEILHTTLAQSLRFPEWYGRNLDALYDCITDINEEVFIQLLHKSEFTAHLGNYAKGFFKVMLQASEENSKIRFQIYDS